MSQRVEDYALIGDSHTAALVGRDGSIDWLCVPRFDSAACFAALLGTPANGRWLIAPKTGGPATRRSYEKDTLVLVQEWDTPTGTLRITDFMPPRHHHPRIFRLVEGLRGEVEMTGQLVIRFEYGYQVPWVSQTGNGIRAIAGPDLVEIDSPVPQEPVHMHHEASFVVKEGEEYAFRLHWAPSFDEESRDLECATALDETRAFWRDWSRPSSDVQGQFGELVQRSLITLKALIYAPTGGIVAAPTTSLPEDVGGSRNWDYRYCWVRDASLTLDGLVESGHLDEARAWFRWLLRAAAGNPDQLQIMYGVAGERRLPELELDWLCGYESSRPVRVGNAASLQFQLDVFGELMEAIDMARGAGAETEKDVSGPATGAGRVRREPLGRARSGHLGAARAASAVDLLEGHGVGGYGQGGQGCRAVRARGAGGPLAQGTGHHPRAGMQLWVTTPRSARSPRPTGPRSLMPACSCCPGWDFCRSRTRGVISTIEAVQRELVVDGFVLRYRSSSGVDGLPGDEGAFLPCTLWLVAGLGQAGPYRRSARVLQPGGGGGQ